ncbi:MAG: glutathione S-transferase [Kofleriaceae bacterium]|nr:glutathione S-transferase [Kofleriaceae bacterium]MBP9166111.1 glutathione S-transferase [Kofleriaceae bacterium]MBP9856941.1 glutathione S-transferase [Kofleriaceae bacterium]
MITVHHLERSRSHRVLWLLEELGLPYELERYARDPATMLAPPALRAIHPLGKSPVVTDDGVTVAESGAILEYLVERHGGGRLVPATGTPAHLRYRYFLHYAEGSLMPPLLVKLITHKISTAKMPFFARPIARKIAGSIDAGFVAPNLTRHLAFLEAELEGRAWFTGDEMTAADIQMSYPLEAALARGGAAARTPNLTRVLTAMRARPAYARAIERGGPIMLDD